MGVEFDQSEALFRLCKMDYALSADETVQGEGGILPGRIIFQAHLLIGKDISTENIWME